LLRRSFPHACHDSSRDITHLDIEFLMGPVYQKKTQASTAALTPFYQDKGRCKPFPAGVCRVLLVQTEQKGQQLAGGNLSP
jgi:hypothetical protein